MTQRYGDTSSKPTISWLHVFGFMVVLWAASSDVLAQALVTEVHGNVLRGANRVTALETLKSGERLRLNTDSKVGLFVAEEASLYVVRGPAEVVVGNRGVTANGQPVNAMKLHDAYKTVKAGSAEMVQGSMVMRSSGSLRVIGPEGLVAPGDARSFTWTQQPGSWRFELSTDAGALVHRAEARDGKLALPPEVNLQAGGKYVWGILPGLGGTTPTDWTEFTVVEAGSFPARPTEDASTSEKLLYAAWLKSRGLERAAVRIVSSAAR